MGDAMVTADSLIGCYMMANRMHGVIYVGVSSQLVTRVGQHRAEPARTSEYRRAFHSVYHGSRFP